MKMRLLVLPLSVLSLVAFLITSRCSATIVTFDNLSESATGSFLTSGYQGLNWSNFFCFNAILSTNRHDTGVSGYYYGMVSASNVAYNASGDPTEVDSSGTNFNFLSTYLTGAWSSNLNIEVQGFRGGSLVYSQTIVAGATSPTLFTFNYLNIDRLTFNAFGGQDAGFPTALGLGGSNFVMDNFTFTLVPEPSPLLLTAAAALLLWPLLKRKRAA